MAGIKYNKILIVSDNLFLILAFYELTLRIKGLQVDYTCTASNKALLSNTSLPMPIKAIDVKKEYEDIARKYQLVFSLHCKQLFPAELVKQVKCINLHPGYNPYNRGWFPQVFSILNKFPMGATLHEIDAQLDHGAIIARERVRTYRWETSLDIYNKVQLLEVELLKANLENILNDDYVTVSPEEEGNVNLKKDFNRLCQLDLNEVTTLGNAIDKLRALTHGEYTNAFFTDPETGQKIFVKIVLEKKD